jgi:hypothetical protein
MDYQNCVVPQRLHCENIVIRKCEYGFWKSQVIQKSQVTS